MKIHHNLVLILLCIVLSACANPAVSKNSNADLIGITVSDGILNPVFDPAIMAYTVILDNDATTVTIAGFPDDQNATMTISTTILDEFTPGEAQISEITVTAENGTSKSYILTVFVPLELRFEGKYPEGHPSSIANHEFASIVQDRTGGRILIEVLSGITKDEATFLADLENSNLEITILGIQSVNAKDQRLDSLLLPYLFQDSTHFVEAMSGEPGDTILSEFPAGTGLLPLSLYNTGIRSFFTVEELSATPGSVWLQDRDIRVINTGYFNGLLNALDGTIVYVPFNQNYSALDNGSLDGGEQTISVYSEAKFYEVAPHFYLDEHIIMPDYVVINEAVFNNLSMADKSILRQAALDAALLQYEEFDDYSQILMASLVDEGAIIHQLTDTQKMDLRQAVQNMYDDQVLNTTSELVESIESLRRVPVE